MYAQVVNNPLMNGDRRNQALVGMSDGIPMFRAKCSRCVVPIALRNANLPEHLGIKFRHIHLAALYPGEFWIVQASKWKRVERKPKTIIPLLFLLADDLLHWQDGDYVSDSSMDLSNRSSSFLLRVCLLFWCGDYPGLAEMSGFLHGVPTNGMCHWCLIKGKHNRETGSCLYGGYCRWLRPGDPLREGNEERKPPAREHTKTCRQAEDNEEWCGLVKDTPVKFTGVNLFCPLACLYQFDMIWDILLDYMHTVKNFWEARMIPTFMGDRRPKKRYSDERPKEADPDYENKMEELRKMRTAWMSHANVHALCTIPRDETALVDRRIKHLCGQPDWIRPTLVTFPLHLRKTLKKLLTFNLNVNNSLTFFEIVNVFYLLSAYT